MAGIKGSTAAVAQVQSDVHPYRWVILALCVTSFILTFVTRFAWPPLIPVVVPILGMKMSQAGAFMSAFYIGYVITQVPAGLLTDFIGIRLVLTLCLLIEGVSTFAMGYINTYDSGFTWRVICGLGAGADFAACTRAIMEWFPARERGTAMGILLAGPSGGIVLAGLAVPILNDMIGWQGVFKAIGVVTFIAGIVIYFTVRTSGTAKMGSRIVEGFKVVFGSKDLILTSLAGFCLLWCELGTATWTVATIKSLGMSLKVAASILMLYGIGGVLGPIVSGVISDKLGGRKTILMIGLALTAPITIIFGYQTGVLALSVMGFIFGFVSYFSNPHLSVLVSEFAGQQYAATANGTSNFIFQTASIIGPWIMGMSIDITHNYHYPFWIMAAGPILGILVLIPVNTKNVRA
jgi:ACS family hexuronate transporter-like MFS transporter